VLRNAKLASAVARQGLFEARGDDEWRCWPSGPLPPNSKILGTDQNIMSYAADEGVEVMATEGNGKFGIGIGLKQAHRGIEISHGKFGVQISEIAPGGAAYAARNAGHQIRVGDYLLFIDGWSCAQVCVCVCLSVCLSVCQSVCILGFL
jgi:hypothetical protein